MAKKHVYWLVAAVGLAAVSGGAWWWQKRPVSQADKAVSTAPEGRSASGAPSGRPGGIPNVEVAQVKPTRLVDDAPSVGTLRSRQSVVLRPEVSGRVVQIGFADGAPVRKGQLLVRLDDSLQKAELSQAQAQLSIARANHKRNEELVAQNFVAQRVLDENRATVQVAEAQVQLAEARLARMRMLAPFDGTAGIKSFNLGDYVKDGAELVALEDTSALFVDFRLPERYQERVSIKQGVQVQFDALPGKTFKAQVQAIEPSVDANGRSLLVRAKLLDLAKGGLRSGTFARVSVLFGVEESALMVPEEAVVPQGGRQAVFKITKEGEGDAAKTLASRVEVRLGLRRGGQVQILEGLAEGDTIVTAGQQRMQREGSTPVKIVEMGRKGGAPGAAPTGRPQGNGA